MQTSPSTIVADLPLVQLTTRRNQALGILRESIIRGEVGPGTRLVSSMLAAQLGVSRTPLREALQLLEAEGFVTRGSGGVFEVTDLEDGDLEELFRLRAQLESLVARYAATRATPAEIASLESALVRMESPSRDGALTGTEMLGAEFHRLLKLCARLRFTSMQLEVLSGHVDRYRVRAFNQPGRPRAAVDEHREILACIKRRDGVAAAEAMHRHVWNAWLTVRESPMGDQPE
jgi:DNA-binding GntR family transcriptional regulator